jgi:hypothetical protein
LETAVNRAGFSMDRAERRGYPGELSSREEICLAERRAMAGVSGGVPVGLALSGGGIRSATFGLGLIRALAKSRLLHRIDFLSTVSGGGYIGAFLGALYARAEPASVPEEDTRRAGDVEAALASPQSALVGRLRENGRYLSPNGSGDTLLAAAVMLRNWMAIQVVVGTALLTLFVAADALRLALPATSESALLQNRAVAGHIWWSAWMALPPIVLAVWVVPCAWAYWLVGRYERRPGRGLFSRGLDWLGGNRGRLSLLIVPLIFLPGLQDPLRELLRGAPVSALASLLAVGRSLAHVPDALLRGDFALLLDPLRGLLPKGRLLWPAAAVVVSAAFASVSWIGPKGGRRRLTVALKSGLLVTAALLLFALVDSVGQTLYAVIAEQGHLWRWLAPAAPLVAAVPFAQKLLALLKPAEPRKRPRLPLAASALLGAAVVAGAFTIAVAALGDAIAWNGVPPANDIARRIIGGEAPEAPEASEAVEGARLVAVLLLLGALSWCLGRAFAFLNDSTLAPLYAARLRRAYLGASNRKREEDGSLRAVTDDVEGDDIPFAAYRPWKHGGPLHLLNVTLNETTNGSSQIEQRDRRGLGMAFGPGGISVGVQHHAVWKRLDDFGEGLDAVPLVGRFEVFPSREGRVIFAEPLDLSRLVAISGAAVSTGIGSRTSLGISLLLGLLNLRLGHWWYSGVDPKWRRQPLRTVVAAWLQRRVAQVRRWLPRSWRGGSDEEEPLHARSAQPAALGVWGWIGSGFSRHFPVQTHLLHEFLARFPGPAGRNWYLSDGGHFENSGCYELIRRRLPLIIVSDCGADPEYRFADFAHLVRKARLDFGAEISLATPEDLERIDPSVRRHFANPGIVRKRRSGSEDGDDFSPVDDQRRWNGAHALLCFVDYDEDPAHSSVLIWIKPSLCGDEPSDILDYALGCPSFPQESTADQYFDEAQWESYHRLGLVVGERLFAGAPADATGWHPASLDPSALLTGSSGESRLVRKPMFRV